MSHVRIVIPVFGGSTVLNCYYATYSGKNVLNFMRNLKLAHILVNIMHSTINVSSYIYFVICKIQFVVQFVKL